LVLENKVSQAINVLKNNNGKSNSIFFDAYLLLVLDSLKKNDFEKTDEHLKKLTNIDQLDKFNLAIAESLKQYIYVFKEKKILVNKKDLGKLSFISETFQRCYLEDISTDEYFNNLINDKDADYTRYIYFYLSYLVENNRVEDAKKITANLDYINTTLLLSQGKSWIQNKSLEKFYKVFSCENPSDIVGEFLFLISNLYSSQNDFEKSNFYLNLSNFLNPKFVFNLSLVAENQYLNKEYDKAKKTLKKFKKEDNFYYWFRIKKEAQIIAKLRNKKESLNYITSEFDKIEKINNKILFDIANFYKNAKKYEKAIKYYSQVINTLEDSSKMKSDLLYRRGGSYERINDFQKADEDLLYALETDPEDAYILNYLAYSWLERDYKINEAIEMLEKAYSLKSNDPYITDSIGWAYYLVEDYFKAEKFLRKALELMPDDPIVNDHYGDILWKLGREIQARYFWGNVLEMDDAEKEMIKNINIKMIDGLKKSS
jgi:tetratricopeptide (TPR) repeat protein